MELPEARVGPYLRALRAGIDALAPHGDYVPLAQLQALLEALDPDLSGPLLLPAELDQRSGLPGLTWLQRARAEEAQARAGSDHADPGSLDIERAYTLDAALGARLEARRRLHRQLRRTELLPASHLGAVLERFDGGPQVGVCFDHVDTEGCWERIRLSATWPSAQEAEASVSLQGRTPRVHEGLRHLLARHAPTPLVALHAQLVRALGGRVLRLARSRVGPFWFPGIALPSGVPGTLGGGLVLQLSSEVVGVDVGEGRHLDPWRAPPEGELLPRGCRIFRERRFCASPQLLPALEAWGAREGVPVQASPLRPRPRLRKRTL
jgi:hypothetical protein